MKRFTQLLFVGLLTGVITVSAQDSGNRISINLENAASVSAIAVLEGHEEAVNAVAFSPDSSLLAYGDDIAVRIWAVGTANEPTLFEGNISPINALAFSSDGTMLASGSDTTQFPLVVWNVDSGEVLGRVELTGIGSGIFSWLLGRPAKIFSVVFTPFDNFVLAAGEVLAQYFWSIDTGAGSSASDNYSNGDPNILSLSFSPNGAFVATGRTDGLFFAPLDDKGLVEADAAVFLPCHSDVVSSVAFNFDGSVLASGSWDDTVCLWDTSTEAPEQISILTGHTNDVTGVAFSPDGTLLVSSSLIDPTLV